MIEEARQVLAWCTGINFGLLLLWGSGFMFAHDWMYRQHRRWFRIPVETFDSIHYAGMALYKSGIMLFNLVPLIALHLVF